MDTKATKVGEQTWATHLGKKRVEFYLSFVNKTEIKKESAEQLEKLKGVFGDLDA